MPQPQQHETPQSVADEIRNRLAGQHRALDDACHARPLTIVGTPLDSKDLAAKITDHNERVRLFLERREALDAALAGLPMMLADPKATPKDMASRAAALRAERIVLYREHVGLLEAGATIRKDLIDLLSRLVHMAETDLQRAREKARAALLKAGYQPLAARAKGAGQHPEIEVRQLAHEVDQTAPVKAAQAGLDDARNALAAAQAAAQTTDADIAAVGRVLINAWRLLVGDVV